jgi:hypothetical protein
MEMKMSEISIHRRPGKANRKKRAIRKRDPPSQIWVVQSFAGTAMRKKSGRSPARRSATCKGKKIPGFLDDKGAPSSLGWWGRAVSRRCPPPFCSPTPVTPWLNPREQNKDRMKGSVGGGGNHPLGFPFCPDDSFWA